MDSSLLCIRLSLFMYWHVETEILVVICCAALSGLMGYHCKDWHEESIGIDVVSMETGCMVLACTADTHLFTQQIHIQ
jgi:general stress protein CsbA